MALRLLEKVFRKVVKSRGIPPRTLTTPPVLVVGNITVGGTGKTPLVVYVVERLKALGARPAVISRGYGGSAGDGPHLVSAQDAADVVGDEPLLIHLRTQVPVVVGAKRERALSLIKSDNLADIVVSDDGLQNFQIPRAAEIVVLDADRGLGNGHLLPAGPLREPPERLESASLVIQRIQGAEQNTGNDAAMWVAGDTLVRLHDGHQIKIDELEQRSVHAVAGVGNPSGFFAALQASGLEIESHAFADHHSYTPSELELTNDRPVIMTEKDAVKCRSFAQPNWWYLPVDVCLNAVGEVAIEQLLSEFKF